MGIAGTEVVSIRGLYSIRGVDLSKPLLTLGISSFSLRSSQAKEASDIILMDDNFASIVSAIMWGRCVNDAVRKFLQFQLSVNIVAVVVTFVTAVASVEEQSALTAVQLLWLNLIMDTLAALALATDPATPALLDRKPDRRTAPLISTDMWKMIIGQSIYQMILVMVLHFRGHEILNLGNSADPILDRRQETELSALVFNTFVFCQLFNQVNCRRLDRKYNFLEGIHKNIWFMLILAIEAGAQVLIMYVGGAAFSVTRLSGRDWGIAIVAGFISWPLGALIRTIPTKPIDDVLIKLGLMPDPNALPKYNAEGEEEDSKENDWRKKKKPRISTNLLWEKSLKD
ncbi:hypothetical protein L7F22_061531 [Adiantum nelumboides]|nr:hypothetical protein [Adiantum nelumboides]